MASKRAKLAREHLERAAPHIHDGDETQAVTWLHLAAEAAVDALAEVLGIDTKKSHPVKAETAHALFESGHVSVDVEDALNLLNEARKSTNYDRSAPDLRGRTLQDLYEEIERAVEDAEAGT